MISRHFWHEIRWCFAVSSGFRKRCLAVSFLPWRLVHGTAGAAGAAAASVDASTSITITRSSSSRCSCNTAAGTARAAAASAAGTGRRAASKQLLKLSLSMGFRNYVRQFFAAFFAPSPSFTAMVFPYPGDCGFAQKSSPRLRNGVFSSGD